LANKNKNYPAGFALTIDSAIMYLKYFCGGKVNGRKETCSQKSSPGQETCTQEKIVSPSRKRVNAPLYLFLQPPKGLSSFYPGQRRMSRQAQKTRISAGCP